MAGFTLTAMVLGWPTDATIAAKVFPRFGLRATLLFGAVRLPVGACAILLLAPGVSPAVGATGSIVMGLGMGFLSVSALMIVQSSVEWRQQGAATSSNIFARNLGSTLGATVLGVVSNLALARASGSTSAIDLERIRQLLDQAGAAAVDDGTRLALGAALHLTFWGILAIAVLTLVLAVLVPAGVHQPTGRRHEGEVEPSISAGH